MATLGELERSVMDVLWGATGALSAYDLQATLADRKLAPTTILTVLSRLEKKGFVVRSRDARPHRYTAVASREEHMADLMHEVLGGATDRTAVLERFVGQVSAEEAATLRRMLSGG
jgi:predicted transcriptional regulator